MIALTSVLINLSYITILLAKTKDYKIDLIWKYKLNTLGAFASFFMWINIFYWMKIFKGPAYFVE